MTKKAKVLIACGTGIATSTAVREKVEEALKERGYIVNMKQCKIAELNSQIKALDPDVVITTGPVEGSYEAPLITGVNFLTGIGTEEKIKEIINEIEN